jgi:hypothetical protein
VLLFDDPPVGVVDDAKWFVPVEPQPDSANHAVIAVPSARTLNNEDEECAKREFMGARNLSARFKVTEQSWRE